MLVLGDGADLLLGELAQPEAVLERQHPASFMKQWLT